MLLIHMASYHVFFDGPLGCGVYPVEAQDKMHALKVVSDLYPGSRLSALSSEYTDGGNIHKLLADWMGW